MGKSILTSKTFWANIIGIAAIAAPYVSPAGQLLQDPDVQAQLTGAILAIGNIGLRFVTKDPIK